MRLAAFLTAALLATACNADPSGPAGGRRLYVSNYDASIITIYAENATGDAAPVARVVNPWGLARNAAGQLFVANGFDTVVR